VSIRSEQRRAVDHRGQFAHIARSVIAPQEREVVLGDHEVGKTEAHRCATNEMGRKIAKILSSLAKRGQHDRDAGLPMGGGTDATRVASYNPWVSLAWMTTGRTLGGLQMYDETNLLTREEALRAWTNGSAWFSSEEAIKGTLAPGSAADLAVLSDDYMRCPDENIKDIVSVMTVVAGKVVHGADEFEPFGPPPLPLSPDWSPVKEFGGYGAPHYVAMAARAMPTNSCCGHARHTRSLAHRVNDWLVGPRDEWDPGCTCFAF
jgi:hypothetical protein